MIKLLTIDGNFFWINPRLIVAIEDCGENEGGCYVKTQDDVWIVADKAAAVCTDINKYWDVYGR